MAIFQYGTLFGLLAILLFQIGPCLATRKSSLAYCEGRQAETCCMRFPRAMDIEKFKSQVATGEDWVALFFYACPSDEPFSSLKQFRARMNVTNGVLTRTTNYRTSLGEPCVGANNSSFDQVGTRTATFRQTGDDGLVREDRYLDSGALQDYFVFFACQDRAGASRGVCFDYFVAILIRNDPPADFPWDKAVRDMQRFRIKPRDLILMYAGDVCPVY